MSYRELKVNKTFVCSSGPITKKRKISETKGLTPEQLNPTLLNQQYQQMIQQPIKQEPGNNSAASKQSNSNRCKLPIMKKSSKHAKRNEQAI